MGRHGRGGPPTLAVSAADVVNLLVVLVRIGHRDITLEARAGEEDVRGRESVVREAIHNAILPRSHRGNQPQKPIKTLTCLSISSSVLVTLAALRTFETLQCLTYR